MLTQTKLDALFAHAPSSPDAIDLDAPAYAGIGSRETPNDVLALMTLIARKLASRGFVLRSGGADGADSAFAKGSPLALAEIFLPWQGFNRARGAAPAMLAPDRARVGFIGSLHGLRGNILVPETSDAWAFARDIAQAYHPAWARLSRGVQALQTRNTFQVLGCRALPSCEPSRFVIAWTKDGQATGGTGQAIRIATDHFIPVINLQRDQDRTLVERWLDT